MAMDINKTPLELLIESIVFEKTNILQKEINELKKDISDLKLRINNN